MSRQYLTLTTFLDCAHCAGRVPLQGPMRTVRCGACQGDTTVAAERIAEVLYIASKRIAGSPIVDTITVTYLDAHACPACKMPIDLAAIPVGADTIAPCTGCGTNLRSAPAPAWLLEHSPGVVQIFGAESESIDRDATAPARPIVMKCPECGGALALALPDERTVRCEHCAASVVLPDDPVRSRERASPWSIAYDGDGDDELPTATRIRKAADAADAALQAEIQRATRRAAAAQAADQRREFVRAETAAQATASRRGFALVMLFVAAVGAVTVALIKC